MYTVYVLQSTDGKLYKGCTGNLAQRLQDHKRGRTITTSRLKGLRVVYTEEYPDWASARQREKYLKSAAGRRFLKDKCSGSSTG